MWCVWKWLDFTNKTKTISESNILELIQYQNTVCNCVTLHRMYSSLPCARATLIYKECILLFLCATNTKCVFGLLLYRSTLVHFGEYRNAIIIWLCVSVSMYICIVYPFTVYMQRATKRLHEVKWGLIIGFFHLYFRSYYVCYTSLILLSDVRYFRTISSTPYTILLKDYHIFIA